MTEYRAQHGGWISLSKNHWFHMTKNLFVILVKASSYTILRTDAKITYCLKFFHSIIKDMRWAVDCPSSSWSPKQEATSKSSKFEKLGDVHQINLQDSHTSRLIHFNDFSRTFQGLVIFFFIANTMLIGHYAISSQSWEISIVIGKVI